MRYVSFGMYVLLVLAAGAKADQFCFALAETYYEQVYCQLQAKAQTKGLPPFNQFKKNDESVQASLLKRPAERNAIKLPPPARKAPVAVTTAPLSISNKPQFTLAEATPNKPVVRPPTDIASGSFDVHGCELVSKQIRCGKLQFNVVGNKANHRLGQGALSIDNKMSLPKYRDEEMSQYLVQVYGQYIDKMCDIGLCGVTMTYRKFAYLYQDLQAKGLDFSQRFEIMYGFLKKDKATMGVSESASVPKGLSIQNCTQLTPRRYVCDYQGRNYIFELQ